MMQQPELLQPGIGKLEQQPRLGHGEGGKTLRKWLRLFQRIIRKAPCAKKSHFCTQFGSGEQEHAQERLQERKIPPQERPEQLLGMRKRLWMPG